MMPAAVSPLEILRELPPRTKGRRLASIFKSAKAQDCDISDAIIDIAQGDRVNWTLNDACALVQELESCQTPLDKWLSSNENH